MHKRALCKIMSEHRVPVGRKTGGKYVEPVESVGNIISFKLTISANNKKYLWQNEKQ